MDRAAYDRFREPDLDPEWGEDEFDNEAGCTHCGGEGVQEGDSPGWDAPGELVNCRSCGGTGNRRDQRVF